jgi:hypothetical protein
LYAFAALVQHMGVSPNAAKAGELQSQGAGGEAVSIYCEPMATRDLEFSGFPARVNKIGKSSPSLEFI